MIGYIYKISSPNCIEYYSGSTFLKLQYRFSGHKNIKNKCKSRYIIDKGNAIIELIEEYECNTIQDLRKREQQIINQQIEQGHILVNINNAYTSLEERKEQQKQWRINNPNYMKEYCKNWREQNKRTNS
jgi:hypothetical protein